MLKKIEEQRQYVNMHENGIRFREFSIHPIQPFGLYIMISVWVLPHTRRRTHTRTDACTRTHTESPCLWFLVSDLGRLDPPASCRDTMNPAADRVTLSLLGALKLPWHISSLLSLS